MVDRQRALLAGAQHHVFTAAQALACGYTRADIDAEARAGRWRRLHGGAYVLPETWAVLDARGRHLALAAARLQTRGPSWVAARRTAAAAWGLPLLGALPTRPLLLLPRAGTTKASSRFERVATLPREDIRVLQGLRVTSLARTAVDLAREESFRSAVVALDGALREGASPQALADVVGRCEGWPGATAARRALKLADGRAETPLESISRVAMRALGLPLPEPQVEVWVGSRLVARVDHLWREANLVGEADGALKYETRDDLYAEKRRQDELTDLGFTVVRWGWSEAWRPDGRLVARVQSGLVRGRRQELDARVRLVSTTLDDVWARRRAA